MPVVKVWANGETCAHVKADTPVTFTAEHTFEKKGTCFAVCRVASERNSNRDDMFTQVRNLERVRVIVE